MLRIVLIENVSHVFESIDPFRNPFKESTHIYSVAITLPEADVLLCPSFLPDGDQQVTQGGALIHLCEVNLDLVLVIRQVNSLTPQILGKSEVRLRLLKGMSHKTRYSANGF